MKTMCKKLKAGFAASVLALALMVSGAVNAFADDMANTLVYAGENEDTINPILNNHQELPTIIFSGLLKYDAKGNPVPDLATAYTYDEKTMTYTFTIRDNVTWHDGKPFTLDDIIFTYTSLTSPAPWQIAIKMKRCNAAMLDNFTIGIIPKHLFEGQDINTAPANHTPVGTGRYKFIEWDTAGGMIILERNEKYYDKVPNIERIVYKTVAVESTKALMLQSGEADLAWLNAKYAENFKGKAGFKNIDFITADYRSASMDFKTEFWQKNGDSIGVLNYAVDKQAIINSVLNKEGVPAYSPIQLNAFGGNKKADIYPYDLAKFAAEMEKLGWKKDAQGIYERNGQKFSFTVQVRDYEEERIDIANILARQLKDAGVDMRIVPVTRFDWKAGYNGFLAGFAVEFDPDGIYKDFVTGASDNTMHYSNAEVDELLKKGRATANIDERKAIYHAFEEAYAKHPGHLLVAYLHGNYVSTDKLVGVMWNIEEWTLSK